MANRTPSQEQALAIEHDGGVLLSAGAGAGKTFVLVEHIYYLVRTFLQNQNEPSLGQLKEYLSKIVVMTFTKKAAGELEIRMQNYLSGVDETDSLFSHMELVQDAIPSLNITTIHGFCYLLIQKGLIPSVDSSKEIISNLEYDKKINDLVEEWFELNLKNNIHSDFITNQIRLKEAFQNVFGSPELRSLWHKSDGVENYEDSVIRELADLLDFETLGSFNYLGKETAKVTTLLEYFNGKKIESFVDLLEVDDFFQDYGTFPRSKELGLFKALRDFLKKNRESVTAFLEYRDVFDGWADLIKSIHRYIENSYLVSGGLNFSDLEYYVYEALGRKDICKTINQEFEYFIIDEFQDTSEIQFQIVERIIAGNLKKIFCVGDIKQAIYGFRGGEIKLIKNLSQTIPQYLNLKDNYRSGNKVVSFNNRFFSFLLNTGAEFEGIDSNQIPFDSQTAANKSIEDSGVQRISVEILKQEQKTLSQGELEKIEAEKIVNFLLENQKDNICILYRKLTPVKYLLPLLIENELSFSLQLKVDLNKDPLWNIFKLLLEKDDHILEHLKVYLSYLSIDDENLASSLNTFRLEKNTIGLWQSFLNFVYQNGFHNSNYENNLSLIESLCRVTANSGDECRERIEDHENGTYSIDFRYGQNSERIKIMTVHASKGLEFDHVILGGVSTNGRSSGFDSIIGNLPFSFKWSYKNKIYKSPSYLLEELHNKKSEFSESKRLFYVACTRAVKQLTWFDISLNGKPKSYSANSWINGIRKWPTLGDNTTHREVSDDRYFENDHNQVTGRRPEFHLSSLGISGSKRNQNCSLSLVPELSVTRLSELAQCPRKFFLGNVLKLSEKDLDFLSDFLPERLTENKSHEDNQVKSSKARGSDIHYQIEQLIKGNSDSELSKQVKFVSELLDSYRETYELMSEEPVRFSFFGHIINGTPDLVLVPFETDQSLEIWDFKTGGDDENLSYWMQLYCYALCFSLSNKYTSFILKLVYVDVEKIVEKKVSVSDVQDFLLEQWKKTKNYSQVNTQHCIKCNFQNLCQEV